MDQLNSKHKMCIIMFFDIFVCSFDSKSSFNFLLPQFNSQFSITMALWCLSKYYPFLEACMILWPIKSIQLHSFVNLLSKNIFLMCRPSSCGYFQILLLCVLHLEWDQNSERLYMWSESPGRSHRGSCDTAAKNEQFCA